MIIEKLYQGEGISRSPLKPGVLRMSMAEACTRRTAYEFLGYEPATSEDDEVRSIVMQDGTLHEQDIVRRLLMKGFNIWNYGDGQTWVTVERDGLFWRGHPDLFVEVEGKYYGLDVKAYRDEIFKRCVATADEVQPGRFVINDPMVMAEGSFPVMGQMQLYLHSEKARALKVSDWIVVIKNKNTAELAECIIPQMDDYLDRIGEHWKGFWSSMAVKRLPRRNHEKNTIVCRYCAFQQQCWGVLKTLREGSVEIVDEELVKRALLWREGKKFKSASEVRIELARLAFEEAAILHKVRRLSIDDLKVVVSDRSRTGLDTSYTASLLESLKREGKITSQQFDDCWSTSNYVEVRVSDTRGG